METEVKAKQQIIATIEDKDGNKTYKIINFEQKEKEWETITEGEKERIINGC